MQGCALHGLLSAVISFRASEVQGEALLSVGEAHNNSSPVTFFSETGKLGAAGLRPVRLLLSIGISFRASEVQGEALLSVGEAHNNSSPVSAKSGEGGLRGKRFSTPIAARPLSFLFPLPG